MGLALNMYGFEAGSRLKVQGSRFKDQGSRRKEDTRAKVTEFEERSGRM